MEILKEKYNKLLAREKKAELYFDNKDVKQSIKDTFMEEYLNIVRGLSKMSRTYKELTGKELSNEELLNGIK